jgi:hypothetical protein
MNVRYPPEWLAEGDGQMPALVSPDGQAAGVDFDESVVDSIVFLSLDSLSGAMGAGDEFESHFGTVFSMYGWMILHDAQLVSDLTTRELNGQQLVSGIVSATEEGEPLQGIMTVVGLQDRTLAVVAWMHDLPGNLDALQNIISSIELEPATYAPSDDVQPIAPGRQLVGEWTAGSPAEFTVAAEAGAPFYFYVTAQSDVAEVAVYDADGFRVRLEGYVSSMVGIDVIAITPESSGDYLITVNSAFEMPGSATPPGRFTIHVLDAGPDSRSLAAAVDEDLDPGEQHEYEAQAKAGRPLVAYIEPVGENAGSTNLVLEFYNETGERLAERHNHATNGLPVTLTYTPGMDQAITLRISELESLPASYRLVLFDS